MIALQQVDLVENAVSAAVFHENFDALVRFDAAGAQEVEHQGADGFIGFFSCVLLIAIAV